MIKSVLVLGAGSAGLMAALAIKRWIPQLRVQVVRDPATPVNGVGESTTPSVPQFLFEYLRINPRHFYAVASPTWKLGTHFLWGPRPWFEYGFTRQLDAQWADLPMPHAFYCWDAWTFADMASALMSHKKAFRRAPNGSPEIGRDHAFHICSQDFVRALEMIGTEWGIEYTDGTMEAAELGPQGIDAINLKDGRRLAADFFIDASGFRSELLGKTLGEPFVSYASSLPCDRAVVGSWERTGEPILPYTTVETMEGGWCWQIEHEKRINRGYVFASNALSDDEAHAEFMRKNPKAKTWDHTLKFHSGRLRRGWVDNVVAMGDSGGFVEPLEATDMMVLCGNCRSLVSFLIGSRLRPTETIRKLYNEAFAAGWDEIRTFLSIHYRSNTRLDNAFWRRCRAEIDVSPAQGLLDFYRANGPTGLCRHVLGKCGGELGVQSTIGLEGYLAILTGNKVPYNNLYVPSEEERRVWRSHLARIGEEAKNGLTVEESLMVIRHPGWRWNAENQPAPVVPEIR